MTMNATAKFNVHDVRPEDLGRLNDDQFLQVVDEDLRRRISRQPIRADVSEMLRTAEHAPRWRLTLRKVLLSVDHQLLARAADWEADAIALAQRGTSADLSDAAARRRTEYLRWKAGTERFRGGIEEHLAVAEAACEPSDRDRLSARVDTLERAIRAHRHAVEAFLDADESPEDFELDLWKTLEDT